MQSENRNLRVDLNLKGRIVFLATNNVHKYQESKIVLSKFHVSLGMLRVKSSEIQSDRLSDVAEASVKEAFDRCNLPVMVEDAGLFIDALKGFPGPYAAYTYKTLGNAGILKLMEDVTNRKAKFQSAIAYYDGYLHSPACFVGTIEGLIAKKEHRGFGTSSFGFDPIFLPNGTEKAFAEMTIEEKNSFSHRAKAVSKFAQWFKKLA